MSKRKVIERTRLDAAEDSLTPDGVSVVVTSAPHRDGIEGHVFYEVWFQYSGGSHRVTAAIYNGGTREALISYLSQLTGVDQSETISDILSKYEWIH